MVYPETRWKRTFAPGAILAIALAFSASPPAFSQENPDEIVAAAVRDHGYVCQSPSKTEPDPKNTSSEEQAWILHCANGSYRVKFTGDTGAIVEPLAK